MITKFWGVTIVSVFGKSQIKVVRKFEDERFIVQMLIETTTTFWRFKRVKQKWHNVARFLEGFMNTRIQDGFEHKYQAERAIEREIEKMKFVESSEILEAK